MTDEDIRKLAQSCAEACLERYSSMQDSEIAKEYADLMKTAIKAILETHCIVEKEKVNSLQSEISKEIMDAHETDDWQGVAHYILDVMPRSFNELFKDTEK